jgi:hypothetical protein
MGFAANWAAAWEDCRPQANRVAERQIATISPARTPIRNIRTIRTIHNSGNSANTANYANKGSPPVAVPSTTTSKYAITGLEWLTSPPDSDDATFETWWACIDLADFCRLNGIRIVKDRERVIAIYPPALESDLVAYTSQLLDDARPYLNANIDKLPILVPSEAVRVIKDVMRQHQGLRFCRGEDGSRWPLYPTTWATEQCMVVQSLWFAAGNALDHDNFILVEEK